MGISKLTPPLIFRYTAGGSYFDEGVSLPAAPAAKTTQRQQPLNIIDVGGNIGLFALYCLEHSQGHTGRLVTLEPIQETYVTDGWMDGWMDG